MANFLDYFTRGVIAFLSFMHLGTGLRCYCDNKFIFSKIFQSHNQDKKFSHIYGMYSLLISVVLIQNAIYLYVYPITRLAIASIISYLFFFFLEYYMFDNINLTLTNSFPIFFNLSILLWIIIYHRWKPYKNNISDPEVESLFKHGLPLRKKNFRKKLN